MFILITIVSVIFVFFALFLSRKIWLLDKPNLYADIRWTRKPVPTLQWIFFFIIFLIILWIFYPDIFFSSQILSFLIWAWILVLIWFLDDVVIGVRIPSLIRLLIQLVVSVWVVYFANLQREFVGFFWYKIIFWPFLWVFISSLWFVLCINSINRFDGINAEASGISTIWFSTIIFLVSFVVLPNYPNISAFRLETLNTTIVIWTIFAILSFIYTIIERKPWWLVRDAWTLLFWFALAYLSLSWWAKIWTILVVLSLVIFDAIWVVFHRLFVLKKAPWKWDYTHLHHRLLRLWRTKKEINIFIRVWSILMMVLMLLQWQNKFAKLIIFLMMLIIFFGVNSYLFRVKKTPCWLDKKKNV